MHSSISSSEPRRWARAWIVAILVAAAALFATERAWRARGMFPTVIDTPQAWSLARDAVRDDSTVLLGFSRTVYGIDPAVWESERGKRPLMLAVNGHYPVLTLLDLADDEDFRGTVIVDIDSYGLLATHHDMQRPWLDYRATRWNWNWRGHRLLLDEWQQASVLANPDLGLVRTLKRAWTGGTAAPPYTQSAADRSGFMRYDKIDAEKLAASFEASIDYKLGRFPAPSPAEFLAQSRPAIEAAQRIEARGGRVVFVALPLRGRLVEMETRYMPRAAYWDLFAKQPGVHAIHYDDVPEWRDLELPDRSHVRPEGRPVLTRGLIAEIERRGW